MLMHLNFVWGSIMIHGKIKLSFVCLSLILLCCSKSNAAEIDVSGWKSVDLISNDVFSARCRFKPSASLADKHWIALELENHTAQPLKFGQIWFTLKGERMNAATKKLISSGSIANGMFPSVKSISPGVHRFFGNAIDSASVSLGLPPKEGLLVKAEVELSVSLTNNRNFEQLEKAEFEFIWSSLTKNEIGKMILEAEALLAGQLEGERENTFSKSLRLSALFLSQEVVSSLSLEEDLLPALKKTDHASIRPLLLAPIFAKHSNDPAVLAYYREAFKTDADVVYWDAASPEIWNEEMLEPLVAGCEQDKWKYFDVLSRHTKRWHNRPEIVKRVSAALLKHNPILQQKIDTIADSKLDQWAQCREAGRQSR